VLAHWLECEAEFRLHLVVDVASDADAARLGQTFQARRDIDAIAEDVAVFQDDVADVDADGYRMRRSSGSAASRSAMPAWIATAHSTASTALPNSTRAPSPVSLTSRPRCSAIRGSANSPEVPASSKPISRL
jgi:hypothetical protein